MFFSEEKNQKTFATSPTAKYVKRSRRMGKRSAAHHSQPSWQALPFILKA
jgi:hypothetical protein